MSILRLRLTGETDRLDAVIGALHALEDIERLEEVDDLIPRMRDDSSSAGLPDDGGTELRSIEIEADAAAVEQIRRRAELDARRQGVALEVVSRF
jgi:hypothetical protein